MKEIEVYNVGFVGSFDSSRRNVRAYTVKEAKHFFCAVFGGIPGYVIVRHHDVVSLNDHRHCIDWYDADNGEEMVSAQPNTGRASLIMAGEIKS